MKESRSDFLWLTSKTQPYGSDSYLDKRLMEEFGFKYDDHKNLYKVIKNGENLPTAMFTSHLDTVEDSRFYRFCRKWKLPLGRNKIVNHLFSVGNSFVKTDDKTTLGADDKAGVTIILQMVKHNKPGIYYLFKGEELGHIGSHKLRLSLFENTELRNIKKCISLDRRGYDSVITHQKYKRTCSDEFAVDVCRKLNRYGFWFRPDPEGMTTDSIEFIDRFQECTNISVGYFRAHTTKECQDLDFLDDLCDAFVAINWETIRSRRIAVASKSSTFGWNDFSYKKYQQLIFPPAPPKTII